MAAYDVFRVIALVVVWGIPAILILGVMVFTVLAPALTLGGMTGKLYERIFGREAQPIRVELTPTIGEMLRAAKLPPEEEPARAKTAEAKE